VSENLKVVLDTQIFLRALINPRSAPGKLFSIWQNDYDLQVTDAIEAEVIDVVNRPEIRGKFPQITNDAVQAILNTLKMAYRIQTDNPIELISRDPKSAGADYLVSEDKDLLVLERHYATQIVNVATFLSVLEQRSSNPPDQPSK
jgi:putative PIN family toxin of toxin-antitoxin system